MGKDIDEYTNKARVGIALFPFLHLLGSMPIRYIKTLTAPERTQKANIDLGITLAFVAGALNAGGFLAVGRYTSHMTGIASSAADHLVLGNFEVAIAALISLFSFICGSAFTAALVSFSLRHQRGRIYSAPLFVETGLLLCFGLIGSRLEVREFLTVSITTMLLCFIMGLQNALISRISNSEIRTTHITGLVTDIGMELGQLAYWNASSVLKTKILANRRKLKVQVFLVSAFFTGGLTGAMGFKHLGYISTVPLAFLLIIIALAPFSGKPFALRKLSV